MPEKFPAELSMGFIPWLMRHRVSLVCSSYQSGQLLFLGARRDGMPAFSRARFARAMGLVAFQQRIYLAGEANIWRLENILKPNEIVDEQYDRLFVPRNAQSTGDLGTREIAIEPSGRMVFASGKFSCLATVSMSHAFKPVWKPPFISKLAAEDRCHLNGLAMENGVVRYATMFSQTDTVDGWRDHFLDGGVVMDVATDRVVAEGFSMPHSPRVYRGALWVQDSGTGHICRIEPRTGRWERIAFCPGFLRGFAFLGDYALVTLSLLRPNSRTKGLALQDELARRKISPRCGVLVIDIRNGDIVEWMRFENEVTELFDVALIPATRCPLVVSPDSAEMQDTVTFEPEFAPLTTAAPQVPQRQSA